MSDNPELKPGQQIQITLAGEVVREGGEDAFADTLWLRTNRASFALDRPGLGRTVIAAHPIEILSEPEPAEVEVPLETKWFYESLARSAR